MRRRKREWENSSCDGNNFRCGRGKEKWRERMESWKRRRIEERKRGREDIAREGEAISPSRTMKRGVAWENSSRDKYYFSREREKETERERQREREEKEEEEEKKVSPRDGNFLRERERKTSHSRGA